MPERGTFYDIGSNWGYFSLYVASKPNYQGKIHSFEPFPSTFLDLKSVVEQTSLGKRICLHNHALADRCGRANISIPDFLNSGWATLVDDSGDRVKSQEKVIEVATLDSLTIEPPAVMKIDVERSEAKVLKGARTVLAKHRPLIIFESLREFKDPDLTIEPFRVLQEAGYVFFRPAWLRKHGSTHYFLGWDGNVEASPTDVLALVPLNPEQRFLYPDVLNIFACHQESLPKIESLFDERLS
jgi:FkbM family methyltransferase